MIRRREAEGGRRRVGGRGGAGGRRRRMSRRRSRSRRWEDQEQEGEAERGKEIGREQPPESPAGAAGNLPTSPAAASSPDQVNR